MRSVIITSYLEYAVDLPALLRPDDYIVCLDGGWDIALAQGVKPHLLLGDFDSITAPLPEDPDIEIRRYPPEKDYSDLELALRILDPENTPDLLIIGGLGGRLDQTVINIQMLQRYTGTPEPVDSADSVTEPDPRFRSIELIDGHNRCFVLHGPADCSIRREPDCYLSLIPLSQECSVAKLTGTRYTLHEATLQRGASLATSNEFRAEQAELSLKEGSLLVVVTRSNSRDIL